MVFEKAGISDADIKALDPESFFQRFLAIESFAPLSLDDRIEARRMLTIAAEMSHPVALQTLGNRALFGLSGYRQDLDLAQKCFSTLVANGQWQANGALAEVFRKTKDVESYLSCWREFFTAAASAPADVLSDPVGPLGDSIFYILDVSKGKYPWVMTGAQEDILGPHLKTELSRTASVHRSSSDPNAYILAKMLEDTIVWLDTKDSSS